MARLLWIPLLTCALASLARADVVMPPPTTCPPGTTPAASHTGPHCALSPPCDAAACPAGQRCGSVRLCVTSVHCGGWSIGDPNCAEQHVTGSDEPCAGAWIEHLACTSGAAREPEPGTAPPSPRPQPSGGCAHCSAGASGAPPWWIAASVVGLLWARRSGAR